MNFLWIRRESKTHSILALLWIPLSLNIRINIFFATSTTWLLLSQEMNINNLIAVTPAFHFILQTNLEFPWLLYLWRLARNLGMHLKMIWIKYSIETYRSCQKMTKYHQIRNERTNLESHQFLMNSCFWKRIRRKIKVVQKMDLDKTLKRIRDKSSFPFFDFCGAFINKTHLWSICE